MGLELPPGFRFHPTDEELVVHYLRNQAASRPCPVSIIPALNLYKFDPWELPGKSDLCEGEWYFFSPRHRKYPNGARPNRATESGYWKATGTDKAIYSGSRYVGVKKALVFYRGRPPKGRKTEWIMHEYRLGDRPSKQDIGSLGVLDEWVLCRIYQKRHQRSSTEERREDSPATEASVVSAAETSDFEEKVPGFLRSCSLAHLLESDYVSASQLFDDASFGTIDDLFDSSSGGGGGGGGGGGDGGGVKYIGSQSGLFNLPIFIDSVFQ